MRVNKIMVQPVKNTVTDVKHLGSNAKNILARTAFNNIDGDTFNSSNPAVNTSGTQVAFKGVLGMVLGMITPFVGLIYAMSQTGAGSKWVIK